MESTLSVKQLSAGDSVESHCTKCRTLMNHTIVAMVNGQPGRVECNTCKGVHNYRKPATEKSPAKERKAASPRKRSIGKVDPDLASWAELDLPAGEATTYSMQATYRLDEIIKHPTFGLGKVVQLVPPNKVEILFQAGRKLLRCG